MTPQRAEVDTEPFFLGSGADQRFCLFHRPAGTCRGAVLYVPPFAEELNRTRRMAALGARRLAAHGYGVLQIDLLGTGDSAGDFADARWDAWKQDLDLGAAWLRARIDAPLTLWGLRLGALLALDYARTAGNTSYRLAPLLLWQPVASGATYLTQFLRLRTAGAMLGDDAAAQTGTKALRAALQAGETLEIAGYDLSPELARAIDALPAPDAMMPPAPAHWFEVLGAPGQAPGPAAARVKAAWESQGTPLHLHTVTGSPFWATTAVSTCPALLDATARVVGERAHVV
ncbi:hydrolase 2, exosortase A system-associated [Massilia luteola]|uniref:hydrolase 2, exosortase A system-associated n=1 Tax=Massilia luteola TaxID=3081751 RepID=UPI002ACC0E75|nr:hydrolase 2, exosortase A system-associated [Massilia sp. Gc5]